MCKFQCHPPSSHPANKEPQPPFDSLQMQENERKRSQNLLKYRSEKKAREQMEQEYQKALRELRDKEEERHNKELLLNKYCAFDGVLHLIARMIGLTLCN